MTENSDSTTTNGRRRWLLGLGFVLTAGIAFAVGSGFSSTAIIAAGAPVVAPVTKTVTSTAPAKPAVTVTAAAPAPVTVTAAPVTAPPVTVTAPAAAPVTVTAQPAAPAAGQGPEDPKKDGTYLVGAQIAGGNWQCDNPSSLPYWSVSSETNELLDNGIESIATIVQGYKAELDGCNSVWTKVG